ncbi:hypothetical protein GUJ93_ZPchr0005g15194 [Zizania palustris]|uniref:Uncharacterized protein n=1 Tax=Zizania palustris TaxID=103762 RepID=A0A8J5SH11_ZIZPA|nr:hypothetical protein GUJ93_ZPchr0005g15194 [Zizania palustris]
MSLFVKFSHVHTLAAIKIIISIKNTSLQSIRRAMDDEEDNSFLIRFFIAEDTMNYELLDDDEEEVHAMMSTMDGQSFNNGSVRRLVPGDHGDGEARIIRHYFATNPVYTREQFRRRFRIKRHVLICILNAVQSVDRYFQQREDCTGLLGLSALQKVVAAMRILAYGLLGDAVDEYVQIGDSTAREALYHFCSAIIDAFGKEYLHSPTPVDVACCWNDGSDQQVFS